MKRRNGESAFTLIELLTTIGIIALLVTLIAPGLIGSKEQGRRAVCRNNLKQLILGSLMYASDDRLSSFSDSRRDANDDLNYLYHSGLSNTKLYVCPSTKNTVRDYQFGMDPITGRKDLGDLMVYAGNTKDAGTSYELFGFMNAREGISSTNQIPMGETNQTVKGIRKTESNVVQYQHKNAAFGLAGEIPGPSQIWLLLDGDATGIPNFPDKSNNHGGSGGNVSFCDGHIEFIRAQKYVRKYELSQDENRSGP